jgi:hypothetical protein
MAPLFPIDPYKAPAVGFGGTMVGSFVLGDICHHIKKIERCAHLCPSVSCWDAGEGGGRGGACARGTFLHQFGQQFEGQKEDKIEYTLALDSQLYTTAYTTTNQKQASVMEKSMERMRHQEGDQSIKKTKQNC